MMMNMFSIFDPLNNNPLPMKPFNNWYSIMLPLILMPNTFMKNNSLNNNLFKKLIMMNMKELSYNMKKSTKAHMLLLTIFLWLMLNNLSSMLPFIFPSNIHMALSFATAIVLISSIDTYANSNLLKKTLTHLTPNNTPILLAPLMVLIELISNNIRVITISTRLTANIMAGHIILSMILNPMTNMISSFFMISIQMPLIFMELIVAYIQAYVFMTLLSLYSSQNTN